MGVAALLRHVRLLADEGFVHLDHLARTTHRGQVAGRHRLTDAVRHEPSGLEGYAQGPVKLIAADTLPAAAHEMHGLQPEVELDVAGLKGGSDLHGKWLHAVVAFVQPDTGGSASQLLDVTERTAVRADRAFRPNASFQEGKGGFLPLEMLGSEDRLSHRSCSYASLIYP